MSCGIVRRHGSDLVLLWLWRRLVATALIRPLAWEPPYALGTALKKKKKKKKSKSTILIIKTTIVGSSPNLGIGRVRVPACGFKSQSAVYAFNSKETEAPCG